MGNDPRRTLGNSNKDSRQGAQRVANAKRERGGTDADWELVKHTRWLKYLTATTAACAVIATAFAGCQLYELRSSSKTTELQAEAAVKLAAAAQVQADASREQTESLRQQVISLKESADLAKKQYALSQENNLIGTRPYLSVEFGHISDFRPGSSPMVPVAIFNRTSVPAYDVRERGVTQESPDPGSPKALTKALLNLLATRRAPIKTFQLVAPSESVSFNAHDSVNMWSDPKAFLGGSRKLYWLIEVIYDDPLGHEHHYYGCESWYLGNAGELMFDVCQTEFRND
jgi:hypothetical protein